MGRRYCLKLEVPQKVDKIFARYLTNAIVYDHPLALSPDSRVLRIF
jgi:hypothetical protein